MSTEGKIENTDNHTVPELNLWLKQNGFDDDDIGNIKSKLDDFGMGIDFFMECDKEELSEMCKAFGFGVGKKVKLRKLILSSLKGSRLSKEETAKVVYLGSEEQKHWDKLDKLFNYSCFIMENTQKQIQNMKENEINSANKINAQFDKLAKIVENKRQKMLNSLKELNNKETDKLNMKYKQMIQFKKCCTDSKDKFNQISSSSNIEYQQKKIEIKNIVEGCCTMFKSKNQYLDHKNVKEIELNIENDKIANYIDTVNHVKLTEIKMDEKYEAFDLNDIFINWNNAKKLDLTKGIGGKADQTKYVVNGIVVEASHPVCNNLNYYYMEYLFNGDTTTSYNGSNILVWESFWLTSTANGQTLIFSFPKAINLSFINVYSHSGYDTYRAKYGIDLFYDGKWHVLCGIIDTTNDVVGVARKHVIKKAVDKVRFNLDVLKQYVCMKQIDFFVAE